MTTRARTMVDAELMSRVRALLARRDDRPLPSGHARPELRLTAQADGGAELLIYDEISWWGITAVDVAAALSTLAGPLTVRINSPGGDVFDGVAIYNMLLDYPGEVTVTVDGLAASAASFIAMAGDTIRMNRASQMMIHDASGFTWGNAADMRAMAALLDQVSSTLAGIYAARTGTDADTWRARMLDETWYTAEAAVEAGLADETVPHPSRKDDEDDVEDRTAVAVAAMADSLFPYGTADGAGRWRLAALTEQPTDAVPAPAPARPPADIDDQATPTPDEDEPDDQPQDEPGETSVDDEWIDLVGHLIEGEPSVGDLLAHLREAQ